jgi:hypothetical protein
MLGWWIWKPNVAKTDGARVALARFKARPSCTRDPDAELVRASRYIANDLPRATVMDFRHDSRQSFMLDLCTQDVEVPHEGICLHRLSQRRVPRSEVINATVEFLQDEGGPSPFDHALSDCGQLTHSIDTEGDLLNGRFSGFERGSGLIEHAAHGQPAGSERGELPKRKIRETHAPTLGVSWRRSTACRGRARGVHNYLNRTPDGASDRRSV